MKPLQCLIVDDEPLARAQLRAMLEGESGIQVLGEAGHFNEAVAAIRSLKPDLVFLDIKMRGGGGFEILEALEYPPAIVFVTAHDDFAIRAFEVNALDYLLKPVAAERLRATLERIREQSAPAASALEESDLAFIPLGASGHFAAVRDILYIRSSGHYSEVVLSNASKRLVRQPFRDWVERLPATHFSQLDRSLIVNLGRIVSCSHASRSAAIIFEGSSEALSVGHAAAKRLRELLPQR
jgi:two-component system, LytTR family, response regulator